MNAGLGEVEGATSGLWAEDFVDIFKTDYLVIFRHLNSDAFLLGWTNEAETCTKVTANITVTGLPDEHSRVSSP